MKTLEYLAEKIAKAKSILIFCHLRPDGDTLGSAFALKYALENSGCKCDVVCDSDYPSKFDFLPYGKEIFKPDKVKGSYDLHIAVDVAGENLLGGSWGLFRSSKNVICIDHHPSNERYVDDYYLENAASTSVIIYKLIRLMSLKIDERIATAVLFGIITDTGYFANPNTDAEALKTASEVMSFGADYNKLAYETRKMVMGRVRLFAEMLTNARTYYGNKLYIMTTTQDMLIKYDLKSDANEGFVDYPLWIDNVAVSVSLLEDHHNFYRVSFRSRGSVDVNAVAREFGGGGHANASGCVIRACYEEAIERIVRAIRINSDWDD